jgi:hypothetical protein
MRKIRDLEAANEMNELVLFHTHTSHFNRNGSSPVDDNLRIDAIADDCRTGNIDPNPALLQRLSYRI